MHKKLHYIYFSLCLFSFLVLSVHIFKISPLFFIFPHFLRTSPLFPLLHRSPFHPFPHFLCPFPSILTMSPSSPPPLSPIHHLLQPFPPFPLLHRPHIFPISPFPSPISTFSSCSSTPFSPFHHSLHPLPPFPLLHRPLILLFTLSFTHFHHFPFFIALLKFYSPFPSPISPLSPSSSPPLPHPFPIVSFHHITSPHIHQHIFTRSVPLK